MSFDLALRLTEIMLALALMQASLEHLAGSTAGKSLFAARIVLCVMLLLGIQTGLVAVALVVTAIFTLHLFQGPYNGGSDRMGALITTMLALALTLPNPEWREFAFAYLALQLVLSYFISGWVKIVNPEWRKGRALSDVFVFSAYPVGENLRRLKDHPTLLLVGSWAVMTFELLFPLSLLSPVTLGIALAIAALFHLANACLFGLNRFFWIWLAAYPSILWFQGRVFGL